MGRINPRLVYWISALYDEPRITSPRRDILICLAVRCLDFGTGIGYCSVRRLAGLTGWHEQTCRRALDDGRETKRIERTRRGHYIKPGVVAASEWRVIYPPMPTVQQSTVRLDPTVHGHEANRAETPTQPCTPARPTGSESPTGNESPSPRARAAGIIRDALPGATGAEIETIIRTVSQRKPRSLVAYVQALADNGDLARDLPCDTSGTGAHSTACRSGDGNGCTAKWCKCRCHGGWWSAT